MYKENYSYSSPWIVYLDRLANILRTQQKTSFLWTNVLNRRIRLQTSTSFQWIKKKWIEERFLVCEISSRKLLFPIFTFNHVLNCFYFPRCSSPNFYFLSPVANHFYFPHKTSQLKFGEGTYFIRCKFLFDAFNEYENLSALESAFKNWLL